MLVRGTLAPVFLALLTLTAAAAPSTAPVVELERMTWLEIRDRIAEGATTAIIPTGGTEANGGHMVTGKHNLIVAATARRIALALGDTLVAPVLAYVPEGDIASRSGLMAFPGTISVPDEVFAAVLESAAASLKAAGFRTIVLLGDSGGNQAPQRAVSEKLSAVWTADGVTVINAERYYAENGGDAWLASEGERAVDIGTHAGIRDTSELMAIAPDGVRLERARPDADGAQGDARRASAERGQRLLQLKVEAAVAEIRAAQERTRAHAGEPGLFPRLYRLIFG
jgi:creatinine amidohydrolase/Fe(II)-dependent formamide hydrolase-like protein